MNFALEAFILGLLVSMAGMGASTALAHAPPAPSDKVEVEKVSFKNRIQIDVAGNLYLPKNIDKSKKYPAITDTSYPLVTQAAMMNFFPFIQIETISPRPLLFIVGERAVSAYFSEDAYSKAAEPKELFVVPGASHVDLYDKPDALAVSIPKLDAFFKEHLK